jgi:outer membrane murein-binding lipoprotein Lpp
MKRFHLLVAAVGTVLVAGCASTEKQAAVPDEEKTYVTGRRIPERS